MHKMMLFLAFLGAISALSAQDKKLIFQKDSLKVYSVEETKDFQDAEIKLQNLNQKELTHDMFASFEVKNFALKQGTIDPLTNLCANSKDGQHIHFITDNKPYIALYEPFKIWGGDSTGSHLMLAFLGRSFHQGIKTPKAFVLKQYDIDKKTKTYNLNAPYLFYSRPKGTYVDADTKSILLDFYLVNCTLSAKGNHILVEIDKKYTFNLYSWNSYLLEGLPMGEHKIKMTLLDAKMKPIKNDFNPMERSFILSINPK